MIGFLLKLIIVAAVVVGGFTYLSHKDPKFVSHLADTKTQVQSGNISSMLANVNTGNVINNLSATLDSLVTHNSASPVVLGVKVTNDSLNTLVDVIRQLPPDQVAQLRSVVCSPASSSASQ